MSPRFSPLRENLARIRALDLDAQLAECIEQLQHPELIGMELGASHTQIAELLKADHVDAAGLAGFLGRTSEPADRTGPFYEGRDIFVVGDRSSFTTLASHVEPLMLPATSADEGAIEGLDYLAITCTAEERPVLGAVQSRTDASPYALLVRLLACLTELAHPPLLELLDAQCFHRMLGEGPGFDLQLNLFDAWTEDEPLPARTPLSQLARDLAEVSKARIQDCPPLAATLRDIVCLNMNPKRFDARVRFDWRV